ncbi:ABC transporter ATP-binding protein [Nocardiopsis sp. RSe5-2]|uniref:ABC transporter ATP-binding protein n=1 Tax=Nocardiopsis endophytica TaxID=3018445 RepID=A0ABT4U6R8_9ACTN|nr:ABC transporter ATP-binding protein [Nocardiopsis endophytica]MDA2812647.1 ABC transporter ATP-binding protein [Nocardiopsis endophytica]
MAETGTGAPLLEASELRKVFRVRNRAARGREEAVAVDGVSFRLERGGALAVVGGSGSGKTTTARMVVGLEAPTSGTVRVEGEDWSHRRPTARERRRRGSVVQMVFQDPYSSLDRRQSVRGCLEEALALHGAGRSGRPAARRRADALLDRVGLAPAHGGLRPGALSGGQRQRVAIARALAADPRLLVLDEAVAALDVSIQAQVLNLLADIRADTGLALLFVTHDLAAARHLCDRVLVMDGGRVAEQGPTDDVLAAPRAACTRRLIESLPRPGWTPRRSIGRADPSAAPSTDPSAGGPGGGPHVPHPTGIPDPGRTAP